MGESARNEQLQVVHVAELHGDVFAVRFRSLAQVDGDVQHPALQNAHQLRLRVFALLEMQTANHAVGRFRLVVLHEFRRHAVVVEQLFVICFKEIAAVVRENPRFENDNVFDFCGNEGHFKPRVF